MAIHREQLAVKVLELDPANVALSESGLQGFDSRDRKPGVIPRMKHQDGHLNGGQRLHHFHIGLFSERFDLDAAPQEGNLVFSLEQPLLPVL